MPSHFRFIPVVVFLLLLFSRGTYAQSPVTFTVTGTLVANGFSFSYAPGSTITIDTSTGLVTASNITIAQNGDQFTLSNLTVSSPTEIFWANSAAFGSLLIEPFPPGFVGFTGGPVKLAEYIPDLATVFDSTDTTLTGSKLKLTLDNVTPEPSKSQSTVGGKQAITNKVLATATVTTASGGPVADGFIVNFSFVVTDASVSGHFHSNYDELNLILSRAITPLCFTLNGNCSVTLVVPEVSGLYKVTATAKSDPTATDFKQITVQLATLLVELTESPTQYFFLTGNPGRQQPGGISAHFENHYATAYMQRAVQSVAYSYSQQARLLDGKPRRLGINDMSLGSGGVPWGGLFDIDNNWLQDPGHHLHRNGRSVDIDSTVTVGDTYNPTEPLKRLLLQALFSSWGLVPAPEKTIHFESAN